MLQKVTQSYVFEGENVTKERIPWFAEMVGTLWFVWCIYNNNNIISYKVNENRLFYIAPLRFGFAPLHLPRGSNDLIFPAYKVPKKRNL